jgi:peptidoglycan/LPS O-acetylase OafA/YrhL
MEKFRYDINLLRAIAVTAVVIFHFKLGFFDGGFVGVDVFFVISGFLMTTLIWDRLCAGKFSLLGFYYNRARRIVPAMTFLCLCVLVFGAFWLDPFRFKETAEEALSALLFYSNFLFKDRAGYFGGPAHHKIFLHTWSLSVEWQFYMAYPLLLIAARRLFRGATRHVVLAATVASFALAVYASTRKTDFNFYLLPTRAWEMGLGGLICFYDLPSRIDARLRPWLCFAGLALILASVVLIDESLPWPAWATLAPTLGAAAVIAANVQGVRLFERPAVVAVGKWSYSIYLWHWPVLVLLAYFEFHSLAARLAALCLVLGLSVLSYYFIEQPALAVLASRAPRRVAAALAAFAIVVAGAGAVYASAGFPDRFGGSRERFAALSGAMADWRYPDACGGINLRTRQLPLCTIGQGDKRILVVGDSFAEQLYPRLVHLSASEPRLSVTMATFGGCPPLPDTDLAMPGNACELFHRAVVEASLSGKYDAVVIASIWSPYFQTAAERGGIFGATCFVTNGICHRPIEPKDFVAGLDASFADFGKWIMDMEAKGVKVVLVLATPYPERSVESIPLDIARREFLHRGLGGLDHIDLDGFRSRTKDMHDRLDELALHTGAAIYDPATAFCHDGTCPTFAASGEPLYFDDVHLRASVIESGPFSGLDAAILAAAQK